MKTAVAMVIFNRPETTARVFAAVRAARPPVLLVVADGPRPDRPGEAGRVAAARAVITEGVDWPCDLRTHYAPTNLGLRRGVASGLDWVFGEVEEAIILEDDCVPHPTFFPFCEELLDRYRHDTRVGYIGGHNVLFGKRSSPYSYYFTHNINNWGWASWRRAWRHYDVDAKLWPVIRDQGQASGLYGERRNFRRSVRWYELAAKNEVDNWDIQWEFACRTQNMLAITPCVPLITNIGMGVDSTTTIMRYRTASIVAEPMTFPLAHPPYVFHDLLADRIGTREQGMLPRVAQAVLTRVPPKRVRQFQNAVRKAASATRGRLPRTAPVVTAAPAANAREERA